MLKIGSVVDGKYKILNKIGQGGMSVVYLAMNEKANKQWAVKEIRKDGTKDFEVVKQGLIVETDLLKKLRHPNLPSIIDVIEDEDTFLIVMDYVEGRSLGAELDEHGAQSQDKVIDWAKQLCDVLLYLHSRKPPIIYRDLKPGNIMLRPDGKVMLIDFGTAREFKEKNVSDTVCLGTVGYAAPEQFGGLGQTDARTDIYGLGATLYHLITGKSPCEPPYEMYPIRQINPNLSSGLEKILLKCVEKNPDMRYQSCEELLYELQNYNIIDDVYRKKQKFKLGLFISSIILSIGCFAGGTAFKAVSVSKNDNNYYQLIDKASKTSDVSSKIDIYQQAIAVKPEESSAYTEMINAMKSDADYSLDEEEILTTVLNANEEELKKNSAVYSQICFDVGKLYWYYYSYGKNPEAVSADSNKAIRMKAALTWFDLTVQNADESFAQYNMALIYRDIGKFYRDVVTLTTEANDNGIYLELFRNYTKLLDIIEREQEAEIVELELFSSILSSVEQYAEKYKSDGVKEQELNDLIDKVSVLLEKVTATTEKTEEMKKGLSEDVEFARTKAYTAYQYGS